MGSSPLMRGKVSTASAATSLCRIIPAHAGKSMVYFNVWGDCQDHPRSCGEKLRAAKWQPPFKGSSPLMRGKVPVSRVCRHYDGIIPAHAGKRLCKPTQILCVWDHPRSCGEKGSPRFCARRRSGSSPLMRGKEFWRYPGMRMKGIIPAHAGKSLGPCKAARAPRDHPRSCGEKSLAFSVYAVGRGSSPLMRGKVHGNGGAGQVKGIIPAHAGKSHSGRGCPRPRRDHPRSCGEKDRFDAAVPKIVGSSPLMRGKGPPE